MSLVNKDLHLRNVDYRYYR